MPQISVIIPVYNASDFLSTCLDSALNQTLKDIEIICVDDGSSDNSLRILRQYARQDKRIRVLHQTNQGHRPLPQGMFPLAVAPLPLVLPF